MRTTVFVLSAALAIAAFCGCLFIGSVEIPPTEVLSALFGADVSRPAWEFIVCETRLPAATASLLAGAALAVAGLLLQTAFNNPLAGPSIMGVSTGASLGVAIAMLALGSVATLLGQAFVLLAALAGAALVICVLLALSSLVKSPTALLIAGIFIGYLASSAIALLNFFAAGENIHSYVVWGLGSFNSLTTTQLPTFAVLILAFIAVAFLMAKPLNALLLGERYAASAGLNVRAARGTILLTSGILTAAVTAWCGPIGFIGLVAPHIARLTSRSSNHWILLPTCALQGAAIGTMCQLASVAPGQSGIIPINAITPIIGVPVIIYIIVKRRSILYFK